jgi:hypothetical protein
MTVQTAAKPPASSISPRDAAGGAIAHDIVAAERQVDAVISQLGQTMSGMAESRIASGLPIHAGRRALRSYLEAVGYAVSLREAIADSHHFLAQDGRRYGVDWTAIGPTESTPLDPEKDGKG